ncbi:MAG TPA: PKD domain-containing protein [Vicinamibacterales bacterium]|nr:PKD domain-containing protein [Vicinamibacterales bacterium]
MTNALLARAAGLAALVFLSAAGVACTIDSQEPPPLTGPSEFALSITVSASPDILPQDGHAQSVITVTARDANGSPVRDRTLRAEIQVAGARTAFGTLSSSTAVTGGDGRATFVYTAPPPAPAAVLESTHVDIVILPVGTDANNLVPRLASIQVLPPGPVTSPAGLRAVFTMAPESPVTGTAVLFDASPSEAPLQSPIVSYRWEFGDGGSGTGKAVSHTYDFPGSYAVTLTVTDAFGRQASSSRLLIVQPGTPPTAAVVVSPTTPRVGQLVNFNGSGSRAAPGRFIVSYTWDFGDGSPRVTTLEPVASRTYAAANTYTVTLVVTDDLGSEASVSVTVTVMP